LNEGVEAKVEPVTAEILLLTEGEAQISSQSGKLKLYIGNPSALILPGNRIRIHSTSGATIYRASVPVNKR
jgi:hypothetical protein